MNYYLSKPKNVISILIVVVLLAALIISLFQSAGTNQPAYIETESSQSIALPEKTAEDFGLTPYVDNENNIALYIPVGWSKAIQNGITTYICPKDSSTLYIEITDYNPAISNLTVEQLQQTTEKNGESLSSFQRLSNTALYYEYEASGIVYSVLSQWSLDKTITITSAIQSTALSSYSEMLEFIFNNVVWDSQSSIPAGFIMYYNSFGNFEFGVPDTWNYIIEDGIFYLINEETAAVISVSVTETAATFESVSQIAFASVLGQGRSNFILRSFTNTGTIIQAEASYSSNGQSYIIIEKILCTGMYQYDFTFTGPEAYYSQDGQVFETATNLFRVFGNQS